MSPKRGASKSRPVSYSAYPLYATPRPWPWKTTAEELAKLCALSRLKENAVRLEWGGRTSLFAALGCGSDPPYALLRFVRLKKDSIDRIDLDTLQESLFRPGPNEWLGESVHFVLNVDTWIAVGEHDPQIVSIIGKWPGELISKAFASAGRQERADFHPFPSKAFRDVVLGQSIDKYILKLGPVSAQTLEEEGFRASSIERIIADDKVMSLDVTISVKATEPTNEARVGILENLATRLRKSHARMFKVRLEEGPILNLLQENFVSYNFDAPVDPQASLDESDRVVLEKLLEIARNKEAELRAAIPPVRSIESFF